MMRLSAAILMAACLSSPLAAKPARTAAPDTVSAELNCDALSVETPLDRATMHDLGPAHSLEAAAAVLSRHGVKFERHRGTMMLTSIPAKMKREIDTLPQGEPIILPTQEGHAICVILPSEDSI